MARRRAPHHALARRAPRRHLLGLFVAAGVLSSIGCRDATQITVQISTDVACAGEGSSGETEVTNTAIVTAAASDYRDPSVAPSAETSQCSGGRIGSIVVVPSDDDEATIGIRIEIGLDGARAEDCAQSCGPNCIEASRRVRFSPHENLDLPILAHRSCRGVCCPTGQTCVAGVCASDSVQDCASDEVCSPQATSGASSPAALD